MALKMSHALLTALALAAAPGWAQDAAPTAEQETPVASEPAAEPATATEPATADPAATGEAAEAAAETPAETSAETEAEPAPGTYYARSTHGDWTVRCIRTEAELDPCELYQLLSDENDNAVAEMTLIPLRNGEIAAGATLIAPLETDLLQGLGIGVDNGAVRGYPFSFCAPVGCVARLGFTEEELTAMKRGNTATVQLLPYGGNPEQPVRVAMSLTGFTAALTEVEQIADQSIAAAEAQAEAAEETAPAE